MLPFEVRQTAGILKAAISHFYPHNYSMCVYIYIYVYIVKIYRYSSTHGGRSADV